MESSLLPDLVKKLTARLSEPLPGLETQLRMTSNVRIRELMNFNTPEGATPSSVLLLLYPGEEEISTVFIRRPEYDGIHSGQISLPGGKAEDYDDSPEQTAIREAHEEIGVDPAEVMVIGKLTDLYIPPSNFLVSPFVGYSTSRPVFKIDPVEVERTLEIRLSELLSQENIKEERFVVRDLFEITAPAYVIRENVIWGATAMIIAEFCEVLRQSLGNR